MRRAAIAVLAIAGCGGGASTPDATRPIDSGLADAEAPDASVLTSSNPGFTLPTAPTHAFDGTMTDVGLADWSCLGTAPMTTASAVTMSGVVRDFQTGNLVQGASLGLFVGIDPTNAIDSDGPTGPTGAYSLTVPQGTARFGVAVTAANYAETLVFDAPLATSPASQARDVMAVSQGTQAALPALVGISRTPGTVEALSLVLDCQGHRVAHAIATISDASGVLVDHAGADTFYVDGGAGLPVHHDQLAATDYTGTLAILQVASGAPAFLQVWGFPDDTALSQGAAGLALLAELPVPMPADAALVATMTP